MVKPSQKELDKLAKVNKPVAKPIATKNVVKEVVTPIAIKPVAKKVTIKPQAKATTAKATVTKQAKKVVAKKISPDEIKQATQSHTTHEDHLEVAKLAYQHLHSEEGFAKPPTPPKQNDKVVHPLEPVEPSIPVYSVALAPAVVAKDPAPFAQPIPLNKAQNLPTTKDGKLKWSEIKDRLPRP